MFLYALAVLLWVDRNPSGSAALVFAATLVLFGHNDAGMAPAAGSFAWLRRELPAANQKVGSSNLSGRAIACRLVLPLPTQPDSPSGLVVKLFPISPSQVVS